MKYTRHLTNVSDEIKRSKSLKIKVLDNPIIHYSIHLEKRNKYFKKMFSYGNLKQYELQFYVETFLKENVIFY